MDIYIDQKRLDQLAAMVGEIPTKYGLPFANLLNQWAQEAITASHVPDPTPDLPPEEPTTT